MKPGDSGRLVVDVQIPTGGHIESHETEDPFLVPVEIVLDPLEGVNFGQIQYPPPSEEKEFNWFLNYQGCTASNCLPPGSQEIETELKIKLEK